MKGDHGSSIFNRQVVYHLNPLTSSENQGVEGLVGTPSPPSNQAGPSPPPSPLGYVPRPLQTDQGGASLREIVLQPLIRGQRPRIGLEDDVGTIWGFSAPLYEVGQLSWRHAQVDRRAPSERFCVSSQENQGGPVQPRRTMAGRYGA